MNKPTFNNSIFQSISHYISSISILWFCTFLVCSTVLAADSYLDQLQDEAESTHLESSSPRDWDESTARQIDELGALLESRLPSTYKFFKKLPNDKKVQVLKVHNEQKRLPFTSKAIMDLYFDK